MSEEFTIKKSDLSRCLVALLVVGLGIALVMTQFRIDDIEKRTKSDSTPDCNCGPRHKPLLYPGDTGTLKPVPVPDYQERHGRPTMKGNAKVSMQSNDPRLREEAKRNYIMPPATIGPCLWRHSPHDAEASPAFITVVGSRSVMLTVFAPDNRGGIPYDGVRHISDPQLADNPDRSNGCWDYTPDQIRLQICEQNQQERAPTIEHLRREIAELKKMVGV